MVVPSIAGMRVYFENAFGWEYNIGLGG